MNRRQRRSDANAGARGEPPGAELAAAFKHHQSGRLEEAASLYGLFAQASGPAGEHSARLFHVIDAACS